MSGYSPTHIAIPKNHADFERKCVVLFKDELEDPTVKRLGRSGQKQYGIDLLGYRKADTKKLVGIQCKKKKPNSKLTATEVRSEVRKALKYSPHLTEYIIVTTAEDDTNLDQLATQLTKQQRERGRKVKIQVWGWDTLEDLIDRYPAAKRAFDPGASPAVEELRGALKRITKRQAEQATSADLASLAAQVNQNASAMDESLPPVAADRELAQEVERINKRRGFLEAKTPEEFAVLANRILKTDLKRASNGLQASALERAALSNLAPETLGMAKFFHGEALKRDPLLDTSLYDALLPAAEGNIENSLRMLRQLSTREANTAILCHLIQKDGTAKALDWIKTTKTEITDLDAAGARNLLLQRIKSNEYDRALQEAEALTDAQLAAIPALRVLRSGLLLASILPKDQRGVPFQGIPIVPRMVQFNSLETTPAILARARAELQAALTTVASLQLTQVGELLNEQILWLSLEDKATQEAARRRIEDEIKDPKHTLRRVRLALAYNIPFNRDALKRKLEADRRVGNWTTEEQFAALLLAWHDRDQAALASFFDTYGAEIAAQEQLDRGTLLGIEVEALSRVGRFDDARIRLASGRGTIIDDKTAAQMDVLIASLERGDEIERLRKLYEADGELPILRLLIGALVKKVDYRQLSIYAPKLLKESQHVDDYDLSQKALFADGNYKEVLALAEEYPALHKLSDDFRATEGWANFYLGRVMQARTIARTLVARRENPSDRELDINTAIESGDWSYLQAIVAREAARLDKLDARLLIRLARMAFESGSSYINKFRDAAIERAPDSPEVLLAAYHLSLERGEEYQESRAHEWFQKAVELSGQDGPVQAVKLKDLVDRTSGWNTRVDEIDRMLAEAKIPVYLAAHALNRQPLDFVLGTALRNSRSTHPTQQFPVLAFSGSRELFDLSGVRRLALDITAILTLEFIGLLQKTIHAFDKIIISPATLSSLFAERQFIRFRQPSEVAKAKAIKKLLADGRITVLKALKTDAEIATLDIDPDLQTLLDAAKASKGIVVRSAPVYKLHSFMEDEVDLSAYAGVLTDTLAVLPLIKNRITALAETSALAYLSQVDKGWSKKQRLTKNATVYLDQLTVTYLHHVGILEVFVNSVAGVYVPQDVEAHADGVLRGEDFSVDLINAVERIRAILNSGIEQEKIVFSARRKARHDKTDEIADEPGIEYPTMDILSDLSDLDAITADDRFLNKERFWTDESHQIPCVSTLEIIIALNGRGVISESQKYDALHRLREGGYYTVPTDSGELLRELNRSTIENDGLLESRELAAIRTNTTIALRSRMHSHLETPWVDYTRAVFMQALQRVWADSAPASSIAPRADWLLANLPIPIQLLKAPSDDAQWEVASQKTATLFGLMLAPPFGSKERQVEYSSWIEASLAAAMRTNQPALFQRAINTLSRFFETLVQTKDDVSPKLRKALVAELTRNLPPQIERQLLDATQIGPTIGLKITPVITFNGTHAIVLDSLVAALRLGLKKKKIATLAMADGTTTRIQLKHTLPGTLSVVFPDASFPIAEVDLLSETKSGRTRALKRLFSHRPLSEDEEKFWFGRAENAVFSAEEFAELLELLRATPEHMNGSLRAPQTLNAEKLIPRNCSYYVRLIGPQQQQSNFSDYIEKEQHSHRSFLLRHGLVGLRRLAYTALSRSIILFDELSTIPITQIAQLISSEDPFSLLFGFELCQDRFKRGDRAALALGSRFLKRLLGDEKWLHSRLEIFSACAVIGTVSFRPEVNDPAPPLSWYRLAVLSHAGVLTDALRGMKKTADFFKWAADDFGSTYLWHAVVDARDEPRWEWDWLSPQALKAELLGRCHNALMQLPTERRPKAWEGLVIPALKRLNTALAAFFPGPLDGFLPFFSPIQAESEAERVRSLLKGRSSFKRAPGLIILAYAGAIDDRLTDEIFRLLEASNEQLAKTKTADGILRCCAYIAAITRNDQLAKAVSSRCLRLLSAQLTPDANLLLLLISMRACGAYQDPETYYREVAALSARFAYAMPTNTMAEMRKVLEVMKTRDPRLGAAFGRAQAVLEASILAT
ncbi:hypothetical protein [Bradyrhizobium sp. SZCCHNRI1073]|uniref:HTH domain-containing protein n=1 Tax=Bradyrhizobium sp. SZCCHNRI1073 TaxID=3057280 RepID=UPI0029163E46|nr:hypothetical protein [Bradyrhizobium sp. SZCCHNRI1073]